MKKQVIFVSIMLGAVIALCSQPIMAESRQVDVTESMKQSIVYLKTSFYGYEQDQPWRHKNLTDNWACGCAVG